MKYAYTVKNPWLRYVFYTESIYKSIYCSDTFGFPAVRTPYIPEYCSGILLEIHILYTLFRKKKNQEYWYTGINPRDNINCEIIVKTT